MRTHHHAIVTQRSAGLLGDNTTIIRNAALPLCELLESRTFLSSVVPAGRTDMDVGSPPKAGSANYVAATGAWTVAGSGRDIWNTADQFNFASENFSGDGTLIAKVNSVTNTSSWAKSGLMFRASSAAGAQFADVVITPKQGVSFQWRAKANSTCAMTVMAGQAAPKWIELT